VPLSNCGCFPPPPVHSLSSNEDKFYTDWEESCESFDQMNLHENLLRGIYAYGEKDGATGRSRVMHAGPISTRQAGPVAAGVLL